MASRARQRLGTLHLWLGIVLGGVFALIGLTGSALVFYTELDAALHPAMRTSVAARPASWEAVGAALRAAYPDRPGAWRIEVRPAGGPVPARYLATRESASRGFAPLLVWIDPASGAVVRHETWGEAGLTWLYDLHYRALSGPRGGVAIGVIGLGCLVLLLGGVYLWWPRGPRSARRLTVKPHTSRQRRIYDLHGLGGLYGLPLLAGLALTGAVLDLPDQIRPVLDRLSPLHRPPALQSRPSGHGRVPVDAAVAVARARFPQARLAWIEVPGDRAGTYRITLAQPHEPSQRFPRTTVWVDQYSARVLATRDPRRDGAGDRLLNWMHPLHNGEALGLPGRLMVFAGGLLPLLLFVTGLVRFRHKRQARARAAVSRTSRSRSRDSCCTLRP